MNCSLQMLRKSLLLLVIASIPLAAQTGNGIVRGTVLDATKAAIPSAKVTLTNTATGIARGAQSSAVGIYYFGAVPVGPYTLAVEAQGFKKWSGTLTVEVGQVVVIDPSLEVGALEATVEVTGAAPVLTTEGMQVADVKDALRIQMLPLNGRVITNLFNLTPGVEGGGNPRVNGMKVGSAEMLLDGISLVDRFGGGISRVTPSLDTIQEYRVETAGSGAQYSRPTTFTMVSKSGTNEIHGAAFWTHRNNFGGLRARQRQDTAVDPVTGKFVQSQYIRNEYGVSAGGPVIKNKTFWFFSYEGQKERQGRFARTQAPTDAIWNGDFSTMTDYDYNPITIYNPLTTNAQGVRTPFEGNKIPSNLIQPIAATMRSISAAPTDLTADPWTEPNFTAYYPNKADVTMYTAKGDHVFSEKDNVSGRFTRSVRPRKILGGVYGYPPPGTTDSGGSSRSDASMNSMYARWNHVFSPTFMNEFQASAHRSSNSSGTTGDNTNWADKLGFPNPFGVTGWPTICTDAPFYYWGCWDGDNRGDQQLTQFQLEDNTTWIKGKHTVKVGFKGRQEYNNVRELQQAQGSHSFYGSWTALYDPAEEQGVSYTGSGFAGMLMGLPTYLSNQYNRGYFYFQQKEIGLYFQDTWKVSSRLTLDLGLRFDKWTVYHEKYNRLVNLDITDYAGKMEVFTPHDTKMESIPGIPKSVLASWAARGLSWKTAKEVGFPASLLPADNNNFAPRLGAAYRFSEKWVLRAGFGMYYWPMPLSQILQSSRTNPPLNLRFENQIDNLNGKNWVYGLSSVPAATDYIGKATVNTEGIVELPSSAQGMMPWDIHAWSDNQMREWTFTIERELMKETALRLSYIGNHGSNLEQRWRWNDAESQWNYQARTGLQAQTNADLRRVNPNWDSGCCQAPIRHNGFSNNHSFQAEVERRYSNGLAFQWFYTISHAMTTNDAGGFTYGSSRINSSGSGTIYAVPENRLIIGEPNLSEDQRLRFGYANSDAVPAHRIRWNGIYDLPFGKGKKYAGNVSSALNHVVGGWQIAFIGEWRGGNWMSVDSGRYLFGDPTLTADERLTMTYAGRTQRLWFKGDMNPTQASGVDQAKLTALVPVDRSQRVLRPVGDKFDNRIPQMLANGTVRYTGVNDMLNWNARNFFRGPGAWNQDVSVFKYFSFTEKTKLRFTADFFNATNSPMDNNPSSGTGLQDLSTQPNDPRIIQLTLRLEW
ncbi:MAG TPA: TonB-dependent receptor [Bryobacteraceae bacterium]|nr:TonB-dependent receptor [Bryobacteraceae bacterium]